MSTLRKLLFVTLPILAASVAFLELGVFRYFVAVDNSPLATFDTGERILKYWPDQSGVRYPDRDRHHPVAYTINDNGWNSTHRSYQPQRNQRRRVAVVGDSFVEAFQVAPAESVSSRLEALLGPGDTEVYSFGISGAPLSQYLHMARYVARTFHPDLIVVVLIHNDFIESYRPKAERFSSSFLHVKVGETIEEEPPLAYDRRPIAQWLLAKSATLRFGFYVWRSLADTTTNNAQSGQPAARFEANINVAELDDEAPRIQRATTYLFEQFAQLERATNTRVVFAMDGPREALYGGQDPTTLEVYRLNRIARDAAGQAGMPFVDLTDAFAQDYALRHTVFEFATDNHWNASGHDVAAHAILRIVPSLLPRASRLQEEAQPRYSSRALDQTEGPAGASGLRSVGSSSDRTR